MNNDESVEPIDFLKIFWKERWLIIGSTLVCMIAAFGLTTLSPKIFTTTVNLNMGKVWGIPIENSYRVAQIVNSQAFLNKVEKVMRSTETAHQMENGWEIRATVIDEAGLPKNITAALVVNLSATHHNQEIAEQLLEVITDLIIQDHQTRFDEIMTHNRRYEKVLEDRVNGFQREIGEFKKTLEVQPANPQKDALFTFLIQGQLAGKQTRLLEIMKELEEVRKKNNSSSFTEPTSVILEPVIKSNSVNGKVFLAAGGGIGLIGALMLAFLREYLTRVSARGK